MAEKNGETLDTLFGMGRRKRTEALAEMLERHCMRNTARFALAGVVTAIDPDILSIVAKVVADELRQRALRMEE